MQPPQVPPFSAPPAAGSAPYYPQQTHQLATGGPPVLAPMQPPQQSFQLPPPSAPLYAAEQYAVDPTAPPVPQYAHGVTPAFPPIPQFQQAPQPQQQFDGAQAQPQPYQQQTPQPAPFQPQYQQMPQQYGQQQQSPQQQYATQQYGQQQSPPQQYGQQQSPLQQYGQQQSPPQQYGQQQSPPQQYGQQQSPPQQYGQQQSPPQQYGQQQQAQAQYQQVPTGFNAGAGPVPISQQQQPAPPPSAQQSNPSFSQALPTTPNQPANQSFGQRTTPPPTPGTPSIAPGAKPQRSRPPQTNRRIDPSQVPSPCRDLPQDTAGAQRPKYLTSKCFPPLCVTNFIATDDGNANPKFFRPTIHCVPHEDSFVKESGVHLGAVLSPLAQPLDNEEIVPVVAGRPPVRCKRCRAYVNPHVIFTQLGRNWTCCFCDMVNEVTTEYFCNLDGNNRRRDALEKSELSRGSVEFDVQGVEEYSLKNEKGELIPARPMQHLFAIDISKSTEPHLQDVVDSMRNSLHHMAQLYPQCRVSFFTYATTLHFYNFQHALVPQLVVADVDAPFVPLPYNLLCWMTLGRDMEKIEAFLDRLVELRETADETDSCIGAACKVASLILSETGGRVILTGHRLPNAGTGVIKPREQHKLYGTEKEKELLKPLDGFWSSIAIECAKKQISFDVMLFPQEYVELVTLGQICHLTNGTQSLFENYNGPSDRLRLQAAFDHCLLQEAGYAGILRVRCSNGVKVRSYRGHYLSQDPHDMDLAAIQGSSTFFVDFQHEQKLDPKSYAYFQCALLYTTRGGQRRVRVHTLKLPVSNTYATLYKNCDLEANAFCTVQECLVDAVNKGPKYAREAAVERLTKMLTSYRKYCSSGSHSSQLLMPELLKLLPIYTLCILKSDALTPGTSTRIDERVQCIFDLMGMPLHRILFFLYPRMYAVQNLLNHPTAGILNPQTSLCQLPTMQQLTSEVIMSHGIYVLHDQQAKLVYLWIGSQVAPRVSQSLFGVDDSNQVGVTVAFEQFHERLRNVLHALMMNDLGAMDRLLIVHEHDAAEEAFFRNMLEDETAPGTQSYSDLLCLLHKQINTRLS